jgi:hypothetical protein
MRIRYADRALVYKARMGGGWWCSMRGLDSSTFTRHSTWLEAMQHACVAVGGRYGHPDKP